MAKKARSFSHVEAQDALERLNGTKPTGEELVYDLLRIFCGYGDGNIRRIRDGVGNKASDGRTVLIPNLIAYRPKGTLDFHDEIKAMQADGVSALIECGPGKVLCGLNRKIDKSLELANICDKDSLNKAIELIK